MDKIIIQGGIPLYGSIRISGAKNSALPLMAACLLTKDTVTLANIPYISDISTMCKVLTNHGVEAYICGDNTSYENHHRALSLNASKITNYHAPYDLVSKMRASFLVIGPLLARFGQAQVSMPGGCTIGTRPVNLHIKALEQLGAIIELKSGYIEATAPNGLKGTQIDFELVSVGATENTLMAASLAEGRTIITNAAAEPEISDLAELLNKMGAKIQGAGTSTIIIDGVESLHGAFHSVIPDRIEAATYAIAAMITKGEILLEGIDYSVFSNIADKLISVGAELTPDHTKNSILVKSSKKLNPIFLETSPHPGYPSDAQAQLTSLLCLVDGVSFIKETLYENRFMHVSELNRMGADISVEGNLAKITGISHFNGASVMATDLRASSCLVLAALAAKGETSISRVYHLDRGYEKIENKLSICGARISRVIS